MSATAARNEELKSAVGSSFRLINCPTIPDFELTLREVSEPRPIGGAFEGFQAIFASPKSKGGYLPQRTWELEHDALGQVALFLVPIGETESEFRYQCVFNTKRG